MSFKDIALPLIERGIRVIPVQPGEKRCLLPSWPQMATTDILQVEAWDRANPHYNAGCVGTPDTIAILDCDVVGLREKIEKETGCKFPRTLVVRSAGKGAEHIYFLQTDRSRALGNRSAMGLYDLQSRDKYCVAPGSKLGNGRTYDIVDDASIADFPDFLADWIERTSVQETRAAVADDDEKGAPVHEDFDFDDWCAAYPELDFFGEKAGIHVFKACPWRGDHHTNNGRPDYRATVLFYDGSRIWFKCLATGCEGHGKSIGDLVRLLGERHGKYDGPIFADDLENSLEHFDAETADDFETPAESAAIKVTDGGVCIRERCDLYRAEASKLCRKCIEEASEEYKKSQREQAPEQELAPQPEDNSHVFAEGRIQQTVFSLVTTRADMVKTEKLEWLWSDRVPLGKITYFSGKPDCGKSVTLTDVVARVSSGREFPDAPNPWGERKVLMGVTEDGLGDTVKPRLIAAGAKLENVEFLNFVRIAKDASKKQRQFALKTDMRLLRYALRKNPHVMLVALDPITGYWGADSNKDAEIRPVVDELSKICDETRVTLIAVMHQNKRTDVSAVQKVLGASSVAGSARIVWGFSRDPEDKELCHMSLVKNNLSAKRTGLDYRLMSRKVEVDGEMIPHATVEWMGENELSADDLAAMERDIARDGGRRKLADLAATFLQEKFAKSGGWPCKELYGEAEAAGISVDALKRAKHAVGLESKKIGGHWWWINPKAEGEPWSKKAEELANSAEAL